MRVLEKALKALGKFYRNIVAGKEGVIDKSEENLGNWSKGNTFMLRQDV